MIKPSLQTRSERVLSQDPGSLLSSAVSQRLFSGQLETTRIEDLKRMNTMGRYTSQTNLPSSSVLSLNTHKLRREETLGKKKVIWERIDTIKQDMYRQHQKKRIDELFYGKNSGANVDFRVRHQSSKSARQSKAVPTKVSVQTSTKNVEFKAIGDFHYWLVRPQTIQVIGGRQGQQRLVSISEPLVVQRLALGKMPQPKIREKGPDLSRLRTKFGGWVQTAFANQDAPLLLATGPTAL